MEALGSNPEGFFDYTIMGEYYLSGGLGDVIVYTCYFPPDVKAFHWHSRARPDIEPIFRKLYPDALHFNHLDRESEDAERMAAVESWHDGECPPGVENWVVANKFYELRDHPELWRPSPILSTKLAEVDRFNLPARYIVVQHDTPFNGASVRNPRQIVGEEWASVLQHAGGLPIVVLGADGSIPVPDHEDIIDLVGETTVAESLEILKQADGYAGIDSVMSIVAGWLFPADRLAVKWHGVWLATMKAVYYRPHKDFSFCYRDLRPGIFGSADGTLGEKVAELRRKVRELYTDMELPEYIKIQKAVVLKKAGVLHVLEAGTAVETADIARPLVLDWFKTGSAVAVKKPVPKKKAEKEVS